MAKVRLPLSYSAIFRRPILCVEVKPIHSVLKRRWRQNQLQASTEHILRVRLNTGPGGNSYHKRTSITLLKVPRVTLQWILKQWKSITWTVSSGV
jgi:hypothetical protein